MSRPDDSDRVLNELRTEIDRLDGEIFAALNRRLELVARLKRYKDEHGISFVDPDRERRMIDERVQANPGPLSDEGLRAFYVELLALIKRELRGYSSSGSGSSSVSAAPPPRRSPPPRPCRGSA